MDYTIVVCMMLLIIAKFGETEVKESPYVDIYPKLTEHGLNFNAGNHSLPLYFGLMLSLGGGDESSGALAGVQPALDEINSRDDLLPGYTLHYTLTDSEVRLMIENYHSFILLYTVQSYSCSLWTFYSAF